MTLPLLDYYRETTYNKMAERVRDSDNHLLHQGPRSIVVNVAGVTNLGQTRRKHVRGVSLVKDGKLSE
ncbi:MAG TPA: hypothetical protein VFJ58_13670 [Armatimonadota bacterium]|nr:hypothetical protein [Armatimonadota bacterium]